MKRFVAILVLMLTVWSSAFSAIKSAQVDLIPPTPNAATVIEQQLPRPSLLTGAVQFSIPLYTISVDGFEMPITLSYKSNGVKVLDEPAPLGYGWTLQPALRASRMIMGHPDEKSENMVDTLTSFYSNNKSWEIAYKCMKRSYNDSGDSKPDIFTIALPDKVLTYVLDTSAGGREFICVGDEDYRLKSSKNLKQLILTTPTGERYVYGGDYEFGRLTQYINYNNSDEVPVCWYLRSIELPCGQNIYFKWSSFSPVSGGYEGGVNLFDSFSRSTLLDKYNKVLGDGALQWNYTFNEGLGYRLDQIILPVCNVEFGYKNNLMSRVSLSYSSGETEIATIDIDKDYYLLRSVDVKREGKYSFDYNNPIFFTGSTTSQDWWGYYNGADNPYLIPNITLKKGTSSTYHEISNAANQDINEEAMKSNILSRITYPGGGVSEFEYETHKFKPYQEKNSNIKNSVTLSEGGGLRVKSVIMRTSKSDTIARKIEYKYSKATVRALPTLSTFVRVHNTINSFSFYDYANDLLVDGYGLRCRQISVDPYSHYMDYDFGELPIWYPEVLEISPDKITKYTFADSEVPHNIFDDTTFGRRIIQRLNRISDEGPKLICKETCSVTSKVIEREEYSYECITSPRVIKAVDIHRELVQYYTGGDECPDFQRGYLVWSNNDYWNRGDINILEQYKPWFPYSIHSYYISLSKERLVRTVRTQYAPSGRFIKYAKEIKYVSDKSSMVDSIIETNGGKTSVTSYEYPRLFGSGVVGQMYRAGYTAIPIKVTETKEGKSTITEADYVRVDNGVFKPRRVLRRHEDGDTIPSPVCTYDSYGNLNEAVDADGVSVAYFYGYNYTRPVIKVEGMGRNSAASICGLPTGSGNLQTADIPVIEGARVTGMSYNPFFGVTSITNPAGISSRYTYDTAGRLETMGVDGIGTLERYSYNTTTNKGITVSVSRWLNESGSETHTAETHYDGLGRKVYDYDKSTNVSQHTQYDLSGRVRRQSIPVYKAEVPDGNAKWTDYVYRDNRLSEESRPGKEWKGNHKSISYSFDVHPTAQTRTMFNLVIGDDDGIKTSGTLSKFTVLVDRTRDEDNSTIEVLSDANGRVIVRRDSLKAFSTNYVYDNYGRLRYILPPDLKATSYAVDDPNLVNRAYAWFYDDADRVVRSRVPGQKERKFVYTPAGRLAAESGGLIAEGLWRLHFYDNCGREVMSGTAPLTEKQAHEFAKSRQTLDCSKPALPAIYSLPILPGAVELTLETAVVYDNYSFLSAVQGAAFVPDNTSGSTYLSKPAGFPTLTVSRTSAGNYLYTALYYDDAGRAVQERTIMPDATLSHSSNYTYAGAVKDESYTATLAGKNHSFSLSHTYDDAERPHGLKATLKDSEAQTTTGYGSFGMPIITYYGKNCWQHSEYTDQGWLKKNTVYVPRFKYVRPGNSLNLFDSSQSYYRTASIDSVYLGFIDRPQAELWTEYTEELFYADAAKPCYSGVPGARKLMKGGRYDYTYDRWSRLTEAKYTPENGGDEDYSASYSYDELGRPLSIKRSGVLAYDGGTPYYSTIDDMALSYDGATLKSVTDKTDYWSDEDLPDEAEFYGMVGYPGSGLEDTFSYSFNAEGLLTYDKARRLSNVMYDNFGNPLYQERMITMNERYEERFEYAPDGSRLRHSEVHVGGPNRPGLGGGITLPGGIPQLETVLADRRYIGPFTFNADTLERVDFPGGFFDHAGRAFYMVRDWNSSVAMVVDADGVVCQHTGYYPYGEPWAEPEGQPYLYAGKERMRFLSKGDSDFGPRAYNAAMAQWWAPDALASETPWFSPYTYCGANPNKYSDLSGNSTFVRNVGNGIYEILGGNLDDNDLGIYVGEYNKNGEFIRSSKLGVTETMTAFFATEKGVSDGKWAVGSRINVNDKSGMEFFDRIKSDTDIFSYIDKARTKHTYDFKFTNGCEEEIKGIDPIRGMPFSRNQRGETIYTSARDIGNIAAGYVAGINGLTWLETRLGFDGYQIIVSGSFNPEGITSQNAQYVGWQKGIRQYLRDRRSHRDDPLMIADLIRQIFF